MPKATNTPAASSEFVTREQFLQFGSERIFDVVDVPGLGKVRIRSLTELERCRYETGHLDAEGNIDDAKTLAGKRRLIVMCVCDGDGNPILTDADVEALAGKHGAFTGLVYDRCWKHCGFSREDLVSVVGNLKPVPADSSS